MMPIQWWKPVQKDNSQVEKLCQQLNISPIVAGVLVTRGFSDPQQARDYLRAGLSQLAHPARLKDATKAAERIRQAVESGQKIRVWGDYDCDGITATALLTSVIKSNGGHVDYHIPQRRRDGYGLNIRGVRQAEGDGVGLLVCVDCGIRAHREIAAAGDCGIDVVVVDHHRTADELPGAAAVINPKRSDCSYPFDQLAGVGVTFQLCRLFDRGENVKRHLDLVALGTIADVVPLVDENRVLVRHGIEKIREGDRIGLRCLARNAGIGLGELTAGQISYQIGPRLNAPGRLGSAHKAVELLLTEQEGRARDIAEYCEESNRQRRAMQRQTRVSAQAQLVENPEHLAGACLVLADSSWCSGVLGPSASEMVRLYRRPAVLLTRDPEDPQLLKGSGRSIRGFSLFDALRGCDDLLESFGGHQMAAGLKIHKDRVRELSDRLDELVRQQITPAALLPEPRPAHEVALRSLSKDAAREMERLGPFGMGNPRPLFCSQEVQRFKAEAVGEDDQHLVLHLGANLRGIGFGLMGQWKRSGCPSRMDIAYYLDRDRWRNRDRLQLKIFGLRPAGSGRRGLVLSALRQRWRTLSRQYPSDDVLRELYRELNKELQSRDGQRPAGQEAAATVEAPGDALTNEGWFDPAGPLGDRILQQFDRLDRVGLHTAMLIFSEVDLMAPLEHQSSKVWLPLPVAGDAEVNLQGSPTYRRGRRLLKEVEQAAANENISDAQLASVLYEYSPQSQAENQPAADTAREIEGDMR